MGRIISVIFSFRRAADVKRQQECECPGGRWQLGKPRPCQYSKVCKLSLCTADITSCCHPSTRQWSERVGGRVLWRRDTIICICKYPVSRRCGARRKKDSATIMNDIRDEAAFNGQINDIGEVKNVRGLSREVVCMFLFFRTYLSTWLSYPWRWACFDNYM